MSSKIIGSGKFIPRISHNASSEQIDAEVDSDSSVPSPSAVDKMNEYGTDLEYQTDIPPVPEKPRSGIVMFMEKYLGDYWYIVLIIMFLLWRRGR